MTTPEGKRMRADPATVYEKGQLYRVPGPNLQRKKKAIAASPSTVMVPWARLDPLAASATCTWKGADLKEEYVAMMKDANKKAHCKNCNTPGHSVGFCKVPRREGLLCQLCLCGCHHKRDCQAPPGAPPLMWKAHVEAWLERLLGGQHKVV